VTRTNEHGQPVGEAVDWSPRPAPGPVTLVGRHVRVEPLAQDHRDDLWAVLGGPEAAALWTYLAEEPPRSAEEMGERIAGRLSAARARAFAIRRDGRAAGMASLMRTDAAHGSVEVGAIILGRPLQRTRASTEAMVLLARHVFDDLGYRRYEWKCDSLNEPSRRAAVRLGFVAEGRFRNALVTKGRNRDTDWFSITDAEWPHLSAAYDAWLDDANVDAGGRQLTPLGDLTRRGAAAS
jgi:RimJ/RimL family protein N-acetyltransferase